VEVNNGHLYMRSLPDHGCVFTVALPRILNPDVAMA
jgi:hypothetical protein